jgi:hypothetical protein
LNGAFEFPGRNLPWIHALIRENVRGAVLFGSVHFFLGPNAFASRALSLCGGASPGALVANQSKKDCEPPVRLLLATGRGRWHAPLLLEQNCAREHDARN